MNKKVKMKMKILRNLAVALLLTACSSDVVESVDAVTSGGSFSETRPDSAVTFSVYTQRTSASQTRAGVVGDLTNDSLQNTNVKPAGTTQTWHNKAGFGVFAYYTGDAYFQPTSQPTFMYNQQVMWTQPAGETAERWYYSPLKYWPNNFAQASAPSDDHVSFFAYAPYVEVDKQTGQIIDTNTTSTESRIKDINNLSGDGTNPDGITGIPYMGSTGDPLIDYVVSTDLGRRVDLCWGTAKNNTQWGPSGSKVSIKAGMPWLNLTRAETVSDKVQFNFRHATAKLNVQIDAPADESVAVDANTRIFVRQVSFTGFALKGSLNLNNIVSATPLWTGYQGAGWLSHDRVTFYDGRVDGKEGTLANNSETPLGLNPSIVQRTIWDHPTDPSLGVTNNTVNLFTPSGHYLPTTLIAGKTNPEDYLHLEPTYVIPTGDPVSVEIIYDVETKAPLSGTLSDGRTPGLSTCTHVLRENLLPSLEAGKAYSVRLHLGLNSVKFEATVAHDWDVVPSIDITPIPAKRGDILFADGTWGNPADNPGKTPIALVFSTETSAADKARGYSNGYAIALKNTNGAGPSPSGVRWANNAGSPNPSNTQITDMLLPFLKNNDAVARQAPAEEIIADLDGLAHCRTAYENNGNSFTNLPAMKAAHDYNGGVHPAGTSEWYLPSLGQIHKFFVAVGGLPEDHPYNYNSYFWNAFYGAGTDDTAKLTQNLNTFFTNAGLVPGTDFHKFWHNMGATRDSNYGGRMMALWTSTECTTSTAWYMYINGSQGIAHINKNANGDGANHVVRPVIAF